MACRLSQRDATKVKLDVRLTTLKPHFCDWVAAALEQNMTLTEISLGNNNIGETGTLALAPLLELGSLERVRLSGKVMLPEVERGPLDWLTSLEAASDVRYYC